MTVPAGPQLPQLLLLLVGGVALSMASTGQVVQVILMPPMRAVWSLTWMLISNVPVSVNTE